MPLRPPWPEARPSSKPGRFQCLRGLPQGAGGGDFQVALTVPSSWLTDFYAHGLRFLEAPVHPPTASGGACLPVQASARDRITFGQAALRERLLGFTPRLPGIDVPDLTPLLSLPLVEHYLGRDLFPTHSPVSGGMALCLATIA